MIPMRSRHNLRHILRPTMYAATLAVLLLASTVTAGSASAASLGEMFGALAGRSGSSSSRASEQDLDQMLARLATQINRNTPQKIDDQNRLDRVRAEGGGQLVYYYTLLERTGADVPVAVFNSKLAPALKERLCRDREMSRLLRDGVIVGYAYEGSDGTDIGKIFFRQRDCSGNG